MTKHEIVQKDTRQSIKKPYLFKKIISTAICVAMIITMFPSAVYATVEDMAMEHTQTSETNEISGEADLNYSEEDAESEEDGESLEDTLSLEEEATEENAVMEESTEDSTVFDLGDGEKMVIYHGQNVRFEDEDGNLTDYDPTLIEVTENKSENGSKLTGYKYENNEGDKKQYIPETLSEDTPILMENGDYSIEMAPAGEEATDEVQIETEETLTPYESVEDMKTKAVYETEDKTQRYEYTSLNEGIKETIVLEENHEDNIFKFNLSLKGMTAEVSEENTVLLKDENTDEVKAVIEKPYMNDRSGEAYSEDLIYSLKEGEKAGEYVLSLTVSRQYLDDEERLYPVTIDPTATWKENDTFLDVYVISGTTYGDINFCDSGVKVMTAGKDGNGHTHQTFIKLPNIKSTLADKYVHSAYLTVYETAQCKADQTIRFNRITESWTTTTLTWNNKPSYASTYINNFTTTGKTYASHKMKMTNTIRNYVNATNNSNYGIVMRNVTDSPTYAEFFGSRTSASAYRPKLVVTYYDKPTAPKTLTISRLSGTTYITKEYMKKGYRMYASWSGLVSKNLTDVQYKIIAADDSTEDPTSVGDAGVDLTTYTSIGEVGESGEYVRIPNAAYLPAGKYRLYIRGKDAGGMYGAAKYITFYVDGDTPTLTASISPSGTSSSDPSNNAQPVITYTASDTYLDRVTVSIDGGEAEEISGGTYEVGEEVIETDGSHTIKITAWDEVGKSASKTFTYYYKNTGSVVPHTLAVSESYGKRIITWKLAKNDSENYAYDLHRSTTANFTPSSSNRLAKDIDASLKYYADKGILSEKTYYYKIVVRARDTSSNIEDQVTSQVSYANTTTIDDFTNKTGFKDYQSYFEFGTPTGTGYIEKSSGNLMYTQDDFSVSNSQLSYGLSRTYNSKNSFTGMFGSGWSDSYHKELYLKSSDAYVMDSDGSVLAFIKQDDGSFICEETKEYTLVKNSDLSYTMTSKDMVVYKFTRYGQLEYIEEPNGCKIVNTYDRYGRLKKVTSCSVLTEGEAAEADGNSLTFTYSGTENKLQKVTDLNGNSYGCTYSDDLLTAFTVTDGSDSSNSVTYTYGYTSAGLLSKIYDAQSNLYKAAYSSGKANVITYPNGEKYTLTYGDAVTTVTKTNENSDTIYTESVNYDTSTGKVLSVTDAGGRTTTYTYTEDNPYLVETETRDIYYQALNDSTVSLNEKLVEKTEYIYDANENIDKTIVSYSAAAGETVSAADLPDTVITDSDYTSNNLLQKEVTKSINRASNAEVVLDNVLYSYYDNGNLKSFIDNIAETTEVYYYDINGNETDRQTYNQILDESEIATEIQIIENEKNGVEDELDSAVIVEDYSAVYNVQGNVESESTSVGGVTTKVDNKYGNMGELIRTSEDRNDSEDGDNYNETIYTYDYLGRDIEVKNTTMSWDPSEDVLSEQVLQTSKTYNANGSLKTESTIYIGDYETNHKIAVAEYEYDSLNRNIKTIEYETDEEAVNLGTDAEEKRISETVYGYESNVHIEDGINGRTEAIAYKETYKQTLEDGTSTVISEKYLDKEGNVIKEETGNSFICYTYDNDGSQVVRYVGTSDSTDYTLDVTLEGADGNVFANISGAEVLNGNYISGTASIKTESQYDEKGNLVSETDGNGNVSEYEYDNENRLTAYVINGNDELHVTYSESLDGTLTTTTTDANGNYKVEVTNAAGLTISTSDMSKSRSSSITSSYGYDSLGNNEVVTYSDGTAIVNEFDLYGRVCRSTSYTVYTEETKTVEQVKEYEYDLNGNLSSAICKEDGKEVYEEEFTYDVQNNLIQKNVIFDNGEEKTTAYSYDLQGRLTSVTYPEESGLGTVSYSYDKFGNLLTIKQNDKLVTEYIYDGFYRISQRKDYSTPGGSSYTLRTYSYDNFSRVTSMVYTKNGQADQVLESYTYSYDKNSDIVSETHVNNLPESKINETKNYIYDSYGRLTQTDTTDHANSNAESKVTYSYDSVGNRVSMTEGSETTTYSYNGLNQLTSKVDSEGTTTYSYDGRGNQISEVSPDQTTNFTYAVTGEMLTVSNGSTVIQENEYNHEGIRISKTEGSTERQYIYDNGSVAYTLDNDSLSGANILGGYQNVVGTYREADYYTYNKDIQGSTSSITESDFTAAAVYEYSDFGEVTEVTEDIDNEICYTGAIYDETTGLHYMNARYYDPANGRFISQDSYRGSIDDPGQWHLYVYCANNPINYTDPSGQSWETILDVASIGWSAYELKNNPSWINVGYLVWDIGATFLPFVPGSYVAKGSKSASLVKKVAVKIPDKVGELYKGKNLTVGKYKSLVKMYKNCENRKQIEIHHIIEKRFAAAFDLKPDDFPAVALDKSTHAYITEKFRQAYGYNTQHKSKYYSGLTKAKLKLIVNEVYGDMPELKKIALDQIDKHCKNNNRG